MKKQANLNESLRVISAFPSDRSLFAIMLSVVPLFLLIPFYSVKRIFETLSGTLREVITIVLPRNEGSS